MIRNIRLLGAALGGLVGLALADGGRRAVRATPLRRRAARGLGRRLGHRRLRDPAVPHGRAGDSGSSRAVEDLSTAEFVTAVIGLLLGLLMGLLLGLPLSALPEPFGTWLPLGVSLFLGLGMLGLTVAKRKDLLVAAEAIGLIRRRHGRGCRRRRSGDPQIVVDTSAIIDGRIAEIVESGFIYGTLVIPRFVLDELQHIADSSDTLRRNRGRRGLEILTRMQKEPATPVEIVEDDVPGDPEVDAKLVALARTRSRVDPDQRLQSQPGRRAPGRAGHEHQLAGQRREARGPARARSSGSGSSRRARRPGQGVGFLDDGTMIVVEGGARHIDKDLDVAVTRVLQTVAGRMIFAQPRLD